MKLLFSILTIIFLARPLIGSGLVEIYPPNQNQSGLELEFLNIDDEGAIIINNKPDFSLSINGIVSEFEFSPGNLPQNAVSTVILIDKGPGMEQYKSEIESAIQKLTDNQIVEELAVIEGLNRLICKKKFTENTYSFGIAGNYYKLNDFQQDTPLVNYLRDSSSHPLNLVIISDGLIIEDYGIFNELGSIFTGGISVIYPVNEINEEIRFELNQRNVYTFNAGSSSLFDCIATSVHLASGALPAGISWENKSCKIYNSGTLDFNSGESVLEFDFELAESDFPRLITGMNYAQYKNFNPGNELNPVFNIEAVNQVIEIEEIILGDGISLSGINIGEEIIPGTPVQINLSFTPVDNKYFYRDVVIKSNACNDLRLMVGGGEPSAGIDKRTLEVTFPNGGEILKSGSDTSITWTGVLPVDSVAIEYSTNGGLGWNRLTGFAKNNSFEWPAIPGFFSENCLIRVKQPTGGNNYEDLVTNFSGISGKIIHLQWLRNGNEILVADVDGFIRIFESTGQPVKTLKNGLSSLKDVSAKGTGNHVAFLTEGNSAFKVIPRDFPENEVEFSGNGDEITNIEWNPDSVVITAGTVNGILLFWEFPNFNTVNEIQAHSAEITAMEWYSDGSKIATGDISGNVRIFDKSGNLLEEFKPSNTEITALSWNPPGDKVAIGDLTDTVKIWKTDEQQIYKIIEEVNEPVTDVAWSPNPAIDYFYLLTAVQDSLIKLWKSNDFGRYNYDFRLHRDNICRMEWSPDGKQVLSGTSDGEVFIWSPKDLPFETAPLQIDSSDNPFAIRRMNYFKGIINFGDVYKGKIHKIQDFGFLNNNGNVPLNVYGAELQGDTGDNFRILSDISYNVIPPGGMLTADFAFYSDSGGFFRDTLILYLENRQVPIEISANSIDAPFAISPLSYDFGDVLSGSQAVSDIFTVENLTDSEFEIQLNNGGPFIDEFSNNGSGLLTIPAGESRQFDFTFGPVEAGYYNTIFEIAGAGYSEEIALFGRGNKLELDYPDEIDFGKISCQNSISDTILRILNTGNVSVLLENYEITGDNQFKINGFVQEEILPGNSALLNLEISGEPGIYSGELILTFNSGNIEISIDLLAEILSNDYSFSTTESGFFDLPENTPGASEIIVENTGSAELAFELPIDLALFRISGTVPDTIRPGENGTIIVEFKGAPQTGFYKDSVDVIDFCGNPTKIHLFAYVGEPDAILNTEDSIDFGQIICNDSPLTKNIGIRNSGSTPLLIDTIFAELVEFYISGRNSDIVLLPGENEIVEIVFEPFSGGNYNSELIIESNAINSVSGQYSIEMSGFKGSSEFEPALDTLYFIDVLENLESSEELRIDAVGTAYSAIYVEIVSGPFEIIGSDYLSIESGSSGSIEVNFTGGLEGNEYEGLLILADSCGLEKEVVLLANVRGWAKAGLKPGNVNGEPGDTILVPIEIYSPQNLDLPDVSGYSATLSLNKTLAVLPENIKDSIFQDKRFIFLNNLAPSPDLNGSVGYLELIITLGDSSAGEISVEEATALSEPGMLIEKGRGILTIDSICEIPDKRLISGNEILDLRQNSPNPADEFTKIYFNAIENGRHIVNLYNSYGEFVQVLYDENIQPGPREIHVNTSGFPQGIYIYELVTPTFIDIKKFKMIILRY
jgi:WD40 repeat protein